MKKAILAVFFAVFFAAIVCAQDFGQVYVPDYAKKGSSMQVHANARSTDDNIEKAKFIVYVPELDIYEKTTSFYMKRNINYGKYMHIDIPDDALGDEYLVRISITHDGKTQHQWRFVEVY